MTVVRRCGRPPRMGPLIKKPTRQQVTVPADLAGGPGAAAAVTADPCTGTRGCDSPQLDAATARTVTPCTLSYRLDRRQPPRLDLVVKLRPVSRLALGAVTDAEHVICSCRAHDGTRGRLVVVEARRTPQP